MRATIAAAGLTGAHALAFDAKFMDMDDNTNRHFPGQQSTEKVVCFTRRHPIVLLKIMVTINFFALGVVLAAWGLFTLAAPGQDLSLEISLIPIVLFSVILHQSFFLRLMHHFLEILIITNYRVISMRKTIFTQDNKEMIDLHEIQDITKDQRGIWANFLNYGDITVTTSSMSEPLTLRTIPRPEYYLNIIHQQKRNYIVDRRQQKLKDYSPRTQWKGTA